ncbi:hypothetical protein DFH07DRAFT_964843 [Mycena maculata]|uniref:Uncharacterized protein n=1 Tax=Mycena maculata TaxID=230809 RepID=A0AAD7IFA9_9AGAR|nr:hypothetical protein DFH07DRAFT_964843 [Mycena maculata]
MGRSGPSRAEYGRLEKIEKTPTGQNPARRCRDVPISAALWLGIFRHIRADHGTRDFHWYSLVSGIPLVDAQAGFYVTNILGMGHAAADGTIVFKLPLARETVVPVIDVVYDYGNGDSFEPLRGVVPESQIWQVCLSAARPRRTPSPLGRSDRTAGENISIGALIAQLAEFSGLKIENHVISIADAETGLVARGDPPHIIADQIEGFQKRTLSHVGLARAPRTWVEFVRAIDWSKAFA